jgi:tellurite resistance protein TehA-like permease
MTPIWIFPAYPMLLVGPHAGVLCGRLNSSRSLSVVAAGFTIQGVGFLVSLTIYAAFIYRLMSQRLPGHNFRPAMFVSVGPSAFTAVALVSMAANIHRYMLPGFMDVNLVAISTLKLLGNIVSLWFWGSVSQTFFRSRLTFR